MSFLGYFSSLGGLSALNVLITDWLVKVCKVQKGWVKQLISWIVPVVVSVLGFCLGLGLFAGYGALTAWTGWVYTILTGVGVGLISNGLYDISGVQKALDWITDLIKRLVPKKQEAVAVNGEVIGTIKNEDTVDVLAAVKKPSLINEEAKTDPVAKADADAKPAVKKQTKRKDSAKK
jgi:uncharacterized membrane protein